MKNKKTKKKKAEPKKENAKPKKDNLSEENKKTLINILVFMGAFIIMFVVVFFLMNPSSSKIKYKDVEYTRIEKGGITFYYTSFNVIYNKKPAIYNIYLRNNPKKLARKVPFEGEINVKKYIVINVSSENLSCEGYGIIALANMNDLKIFGIEVISDKNATCDSQGRYTFVQIEEGEESKVEQYGPSCYRLTVNNCEMLPVTERLLIEIFAKAHETLSK